MRGIWKLTVSISVWLLAPIAGYTASATMPTGVVEGKTIGGLPLHTYTLRNKNGHTVKVMDLGATVLEINVPDRNGKLGNVVLKLKELSAYETAGPVNAIVGRYANRIAHGFDLDGTHHPLVQNAKGITLHGGVAPYSARLWRIQPTEKKRAIRFALDSPDGDQGFPGALHLEVTYQWNDRDELRIDYSATTDKKTVLNPTNHIYFNLDACADCNILDHQLQIFAGQFTPLDTTMVPTGEVRSVEGTALDFRQPTRIGARMQDVAAPDLSSVRVYDFNLVLDPLHRGLGHVGGRLLDPVSGRLLEFESTEPGVQIFSGLTPRNPVALSAGGLLSKGMAFAIETQHFADAPNHPNSPSTVLAPGEKFHSITLFRFSSIK